MRNAPLRSRTPKAAGQPPWQRVTAVDRHLVTVREVFSLPQKVDAFDIAGRRQPVGDRCVQALSACTASTESDRAWLRGLNEIRPGYVPALLDDRLALLPRDALER